jgi:2-polyprenyl-6-methoxyphenol hydroxylase-like FAD-dependent oxidoreductase
MMFRRSTSEGSVGRTNSHCLVIGGGISGLLAAHALAGRFERVTVLERFRYPTDSIWPAPPARRGVPQSRCIHLLMAAGAVAFDKLMPRWSEQLVALGAGPFDACADAALRFPAGWLHRTRSGITTYACSRALFEKTLRCGLAGTSTVHVREDQKVLGLASTPRGDKVIGVHTIERDAVRETTHLANLVVDASGEGSALPRWLSRLPNSGRLKVDKTVVESGTQYVSRWFIIEPEDAPNWHCLCIAPVLAAGLRSAMMVRAEQDRWGVVLLAPIGEPLPSDDMAFLDFVAGLGNGELREALARARPVSPILRYGATSNRMMHYERLPAWPSGLVAIGDSVCTLDPYFGLGMTATARGAVLLQTHLGRYGDDVSALVFQKELASLNSEPWRLATDRDLHGRLLARDRTHLSRLYEAAPSSPEVAHALLAVQHLLRPAETLKELVL